jgi:LPS-assembly lipoprotein
VERSSGNVVNDGKTFSQASFDVIRQPFADLQAETNATERAVREVSADIRTRLAAYFASQQPTP